ncbi:MAG: DUF4382 domain-containing protein, partial [Anaerolineae bacterium]|nr:DUF4382 domain-containing protein [Anaerolineae bacterium]
MKRLPAILLTLIALSLALNGQPAPDAQAAGLAQGGIGTLEFRANGEDFVRQGFTSKDGWAISFEHVYVTVSDITAYQTDPPYEPEEGAALNATTVVEVPGVYTIDLAAGDDDAEPIFVAEAAVPAGQYNAL